MSQAAIALNRFGLGARGDEVPPADPRNWLARQLAEFQPRPTALAGLPSRREIASQLSDYIAEAQADGMPKRRRAMQEAAMPMQADDGMGAGLPDRRGGSCGAASASNIWRWSRLEPTRRSPAQRPLPNGWCISGPIILRSRPTNCRSLAWPVCWSSRQSAPTSAAASPTC